MRNFMPSGWELVLYLVFLGLLMLALRRWPRDWEDDC